LEVLAMSGSVVAQLERPLPICVRDLQDLVAEQTAIPHEQLKFLHDSRMLEGRELLTHLDFGEPPSVQLIVVEGEQLGRVEQPGDARHLAHEGAPSLTHAGDSCVSTQKKVRDTVVGGAVAVVCHPEFQINMAAEVAGRMVGASSFQRSVVGGMAGAVASVCLRG